ncbi:lipase 3-like [Daktulosphaira vitifoliae]|uniref:lipase 3-like n=1 Tax=Daktulosphaira vitifoliae TaxID=58002 RepID=UPI0021AA71E9|nr:lipase 3-like [Daktulosphaira vitifoliae]
MICNIFNMEIIIVRYFSIVVLTFLSIKSYVLSLTASDKIISYGYPLEIYQAKTEDDALLGIERIPHGKQFNGTIGRPVILMDPFVTSSLVYVINNVSIAFSLADAGFDVWMPNYRGMGLSKHVKDPKTGKVRKLSQMNWNFSIHDLGIYDFPTSIDFVLNHTNYSKVDVLGVSLGPTIILIGLAEKPEYNKKIRNNIMIAPAAKLSNVMHYKIYEKYVLFPLAIKILERFNYLVPVPDTDNNILGYFCKSIFYRHLCVITMNYIQGSNTPLDYKVVADFERTFPQPASSKYYIHLLQLLISGRFQNFDYGPVGNMKHYNSKTAPEYNLKKVTAPSIIIYSKNDAATVPLDVKWLLDNMPNVKDSYFIKNSSFSHQGLIVGKKVHTVVYPYIIKKLKEDD